MCRLIPAFFSFPSTSSASRAEPEHPVKAGGQVHIAGLQDAQQRGTLGAIAERLRTRDAPFDEDLGDRQRRGLHLGVARQDALLDLQRLALVGLRQGRDAGIAVADPGSGPVGGLVAGEMLVLLHDQVPFACNRVRVWPSSGGAKSGVARDRTLTGSLRDWGHQVPIGETPSPIGETPAKVRLDSVPRTTIGGTRGELLVVLRLGPPEPLVSPAGGLSGNCAGRTTTSCMLWPDQERRPHVD